MCPGTARPVRLQSSKWNSCCSLYAEESTTSIIQLDESGSPTSPPHVVRNLINLGLGSPACPDEAEERFVFLDR
jgi:hypothetical protein